MSDVIDIYEMIETCRLCGSKDLQEIVNLGNQPPANSLQENISEKITLIPLILVRCNKCDLVQINATANPEILFSNYLWVTGTSETAKKYSDFFVEQVIERSKKNNPNVVEIASNDGTFLKKFKELNCNVLGVDPARNIAVEATSQGVETLPEFFSESLADDLKDNRGVFDLIVARNVIPHVKDIHSIVKGMHKLLDPEGSVVIEFHYAKKIIDELHYDSIYHEHLFYFSIKTISALFEKYGLYAQDVFESPISGGSLVLFFKKTKVNKTKTLLDLIEEEEESNLNANKTWDDFGNKTVHHKDNLIKYMSNYANKDKLIGYGASARSSTLLNYAKIDNNYLSAIIDKSELKQGLYTAGTNIPIISLHVAKENFLDKDILLLAWNFKDEILKTLKEKGFTGKVIIPLPNDLEEI